MKLFLCEKPSQAKDISRVLGNPVTKSGYIETSKGTVTWAFGHLLELVTPDKYDPALKKWDMATLPFLPNKFKMEVKGSAELQFKVIKELLKKTTELIIATDIDREGELIARELLEFCGYQGTVKRLWFSALDARTINTALNNLKEATETESLFWSARARSQADWIVGLNLTRLMTKATQSSEVVSVGRVQTPTLALVVRRDEQFNNFISRKYWNITGSFAIGNNQSVELKCSPKEEYRFYDQEKAEDCIKKLLNQTCTLLSKKERKSKAPDKLFSLSALQKKCNKTFGYSAAETLTIAQALYEKYKVTTYPRTDCQFVPEEQIGDIPLILQKLEKCDYFESFISLHKSEFLGKPKAYNTSKVTAHHAIIPTTVAIDMTSMTEKERNVYTTIVYRFIENLMPNHEYDQTHISTEINDLMFTATSNITVIPGWTALVDKQNKKEQLPVLQEFTESRVLELKTEEQKTKPLPLYTEGSLIADMINVAKYVTDPEKEKILKENIGIGTEATRANILETLKNRKFLAIKGKNIISTDKGKGLIKLL